MLEILFIGVRMRKVWLVETRGNKTLFFAPLFTLKAIFSANNKLFHTTQTIFIVINMLLNSLHAVYFYDSLSSADIFQN